MADVTAQLFDEQQNTTVPVRGPVFSTPKRFKIIQKKKSEIKEAQPMEGNMLSPRQSKIGVDSMSAGGGEGNAQVDKQLSDGSITSHADDVFDRLPVLDDNLLENEDSKLSLVIRKPQEGKTFICISSIIHDNTFNIHCVVTMNTISSGMQFFGRMEEEVGSNRIIVFNSDKSSAGNCHHAATVDDIFALIRNYPDIKVIVCCAHTMRIRKCIPSMLATCEDSIRFREKNVKVVIHLDEAHKYIPENRDYIRNFNRCTIVSSITGYSGSPKKAWACDNTNDPLFHRIRIIDTEVEYNIMRSPEYFGVNNCKKQVYDDTTTMKEVSSIIIDEAIPDIVYSRAKMTTANSRTWYDKKFPFDLGDEQLYLKFTHHILNVIDIKNDAFSYNFWPAYTRKATHYQTVDIILQHFPNANVIVSNGNGHQLFRAIPGSVSSQLINTDLQLNLDADVAEKKRLLEPSYIFQKLIEPFPNCPTFITGMMCIGMSVTLINESIGNFDNVIVAHQHLADDKLYQLCRFLFNYMKWSPEAKAGIKKTTFHSLTREVYETCMKYEEFIEHCNGFAGKSCTLKELDGNEPEPLTIREEKKKALHSIIPTNPILWKKFKVYDNNDDEIWKNAGEFYKSIVGKELGGRSKPDIIDGFYHCSTTNHVDKQSNRTLPNMSKQNWWSMFQLLPNRLCYARVFVGYDVMDDPTEYTIYIKYVVLPNTLETMNILEKYGKKKTNNDSDDNSCVDTESSEDYDEN